MRHSSVFALESVPHPEFPVMVVALGPKRPDEYFQALTFALRVAGVEGRVVLDMLMCNGAGKQRYFSAEVSEGKGLVNVVHVESGVELAQLSAKCFSKHLARLDMSLLSGEQQAAVHRGTAVPGYSSNFAFPE
jgi:hypothetical protein